MSIYNTIHPEVSSGAIPVYGFHKVSQQTKTVLVNMIKDFIDYKNQLFKNDIPEIDDIQNASNDEQRLLYVYRDFVSAERKFPSIIVSIQSANEHQPYIGADNYLYTEVTTDGNLSAYDDTYAGMADIICVFTIVCESSDQRSKLADILFVCFANYYRGQFIYKGDDGSQFIITPGIDPITFGSEQEVNEENPLNPVYITTMTLHSHIEYQFNSGIDGPDRYTKVNNVKGTGEVIEIPMIGF